MARQTGLPSATMGTLLRPTVPSAEGDEPGETGGDPEAGGTAEGTKPAPAKRRKRSVPVGKTSPRNLHLSDEIHDRLWLTARKRKMSISAVAMLALDSYLPKLEIREAS